MVDESIITKDIATHALRLARLKHVAVAEALKELSIESNLPPGKTDLAALLLHSGLITESKYLVAKEIEVVDKQPLNKALTELGFWPEICLDSALSVLDKLDQGELQPAVAYSLMRKLKTARTSNQAADIVADYSDDFEPESFDMSELLLQCGLVSPQEIELATTLALSNRKGLVRTLTEVGVIDEHTASITTQVKHFLDEGVITLEQAKIVLTYSSENNTSVNDALIIFGWQPHSLAVPTW
jgi:hypothetical protein